MPNWCDNDLFVSGKPEHVQDFLAATTYECNGKTYFDFERILPMPDELRDLDRRFEEGHYVYRRVLARNEALGIPSQLGEALSEAEAAALLARHGALWWYDWHVQNWGTKWNAGDAEVSYEPTWGARAFLRFDTAWSPPQPVIAACAARWPELIFAIDAYECGAGYQWHATYENGVLTSSLDGPYFGTRGG